MWYNPEIKKVLELNREKNKKRKSRGLPFLERGSCCLLVVQLSILGLAVKNGTTLVDIGKVTMANDLGLGVTLLQIPKQEPKGSLLLRSTGIRITTFVI